MEVYRTPDAAFEQLPDFPFPADLNVRAGGTGGLLVHCEERFS